MIIEKTNSLEFALQNALKNLSDDEINIRIKVNHTFKM